MWENHKSGSTRGRGPQGPLLLNGIWCHNHAIGVEQFLVTVLRHHERMTPSNDWNG